MLRALLRVLLGRRLPVTTGSVTVAGLDGPVTIRRNRYGIPTIEAASDRGAWFGLGFCQGQDRAFQLEGHVRLVRGRLAEAFGSKGLAADRLARRIGFRRSAETQLGVVGAEARTVLESFAQGVNAGRTVGLRHKRPHELVLARVRELLEWDAADVLGLLKVISFVLPSNWDAELARLATLTLDGPEALLALEPEYAAWLNVTAPVGAKAGAAAGRLAAELDVVRAVVGTGGASNNWAIAGSRTATGRPLVACDTHLDGILPSQWYLADVQGPGWRMTGAAFAGTPAFGAGHNGHVAWGVTAGLADNTDLFLEELGPDGASVREGDALVPCAIYRERILVRDAAPVEELVLETGRGPIVGPALEGGHASLSLSATWLRPRPISSLTGFPRARTVGEFRESLRSLPLLPLNFVFADVAGRIAWQLAGDVPKRRAGHGLMPLPGWDPRVGWEDEPVPFDQLPGVVNPPQGFVATANNQPLPAGFVATASNQPPPADQMGSAEGIVATARNQPRPADRPGSAGGVVATANNPPATGDRAGLVSEGGGGSGPFLGVDWLDGYRVTRIVEVLAQRDDWDLEGVQVLQRDQVSLVWRDVRSEVLAVAVSGPDQVQGLALLREWDGVMGPDAVGATVFEVFLGELARCVVEARAPRSVEWALGKGGSIVTPVSIFGFRRAGHLVKLVRERPEGWFARGWDAEIADALGRAVTRLRAARGDDWSSWRWGDVRPLELRHPFGATPRLATIFNRGPLRVGGDANTVLQAASPLFDVLSPVRVVPTMRIVMDVGNWKATRVVLAGGESGNPVSPHYDDLVDVWHRGEGVPFGGADGEMETSGGFAQPPATARNSAHATGSPATTPGTSWLGPASSG